MAPTPATSTVVGRHSICRGRLTEQPGDSAQSACEECSGPGHRVAPSMAARSVRRWNTRHPRLSAIRRDNERLRKTHLALAWLALATLGPERLKYGRLPIIGGLSLALGAAFRMYRPHHVCPFPKVVPGSHHLNMGLQTSGRASVLFRSRDRSTTLVGGQREPLGSEGRLLLTTSIVRQPQTKRGPRRRSMKRWALSRSASNAKLL